MADPSFMLPQQASAPLALPTSPAPLTLPQQQAIAIGRARLTLSQQGQAQPAAPVNPFYDLGMSIGAAIPRGLADVAGTPGDLISLGTNGLVAGLDWATGQNKQADLPAWLPTSSNIKDWGSAATGINLYQPQTALGRAAGSLTEAGVGGALLGPGAGLKTAALNAVRYGTVPYLAGQATGAAAKGLGASPGLQEVAQIAGSLASGGIVARQTNGASLVPAGRTAAEIADLATNQYAAAKAANVGLQQPAVQGIADSLQQLHDEFAADSDTEPKSISQLGKINDLAQQPTTTITDLMNRMKVLSKIERDGVQPNGQSTADGTLAGHMIDTIHQSLDGLTPADTVGGADPQTALSQWQAANASWRQLRQTQTVDNLFTKAQNSSSAVRGDLGSALTAQFRTIANNPKALNGFTPKVQQQITALVHGDNEQMLLKFLSRFDPEQHPWSAMFASAIAQHLTGGASGVLTPILGNLSTRMATRRVVGEAQGISNAVRGGQLPPTPAYAVPLPLAGFYTANVEQERQQALARALQNQ